MCDPEKLIIQWENDHVIKNPVYTIHKRISFETSISKFSWETSSFRFLTKHAAEDAAEEASKNDGLISITEDGVLVILYRDGKKVWEKGISNGDIT